MVILDIVVGSCRSLEVPSLFDCKSRYFFSKLCFLILFLETWFYFGKHENMILIKCFWKPDFIFGNNCFYFWKCLRLFLETDSNVWNLFFSLFSISISISIIYIWDNFWAFSLFRYFVWKWYMLFLVQFFGLSIFSIFFGNVWFYFWNMIPIFEIIFRCWHNLLF